MHAFILTTGHYTDHPIIATTFHRPKDSSCSFVHCPSENLINKNNNNSNNNNNNNNNNKLIF